MFDDLLPDPEELPESGPHETWILLHHTDTVKKEIRISSHVHREWVKGGKINFWSERIMLGTLALDDDFFEVTSPGGPDIDIEIRRKSS